MAGDVVAYFEVQLAGSNPDETQSHIEIQGNEQFYLGRNSALCRHHWSDPTISNKHLRIHCILYEQDPIANIPPFVYATDVSTNGTYLKKSNTECASSHGRGIRMGRKTGSFLLDDGDELRISDHVTLIYHSVNPVEEAELTALQQREKKLFASSYLVTGRILGIGGYGRVMIAIHQKTQRQLACKVIDLRHLYSVLPAPNLRLPSGDSRKSQEHSTEKTRQRWPTRVAKCFREFDILKDLNHPNIITIEKVFWSTNSIYIFQELITGGDLFSYIEYKGGHLCDVEAAVIVRQILKGVEYLHGHDIVHRDLKPDNILMTSLNDGARVVITDFGNARFLPKDQGISSHKAPLKQRMFSLVGTLEFTAPEIHRVNRAIPVKQGYSKSVDMWSIGSITVALLSGDVIFTDRSHPSYDRDPGRVILTLASKCDLSVLEDDDHEVWRNVGPRPKDFIKNLLVLQEEDRMTATEALAHPWFTNKYHADEFDALYDRAIRDWQPRRKVFRLVESISKISTDLAAAGLPEDILSQEVVSRFFTPPAHHVLAHDIRESLAVSPHRRVNTQLPSIAEEREEAYYRGPSQFMQQSHDKENSGIYRHPTRLSHQSSIGDSMDQLTLGLEAGGKYKANENDEDSDRYGSGESMDEALSEIGRQIEFPEDSPRPHTPEAEQDSNIVHETPVRSARKHLRSVSYRYPKTTAVFEETSKESAFDQPSSRHFAQDVSKRRKLT